MEQEYTIDNSYLSPEAQKRKKDLEENPASRTNHMEYMDGMEVLDSDIKDKVRAAMITTLTLTQMSAQPLQMRSRDTVALRISKHFYPLPHFHIWRKWLLWHRRSGWHISATVCTFSRHYTLRTIVRITVYTAVSTATTTFTERSLPKQKWKQR